LSRLFSEMSHSELLSIMQGRIVPIDWKPVSAEQMRERQLSKASVKIEIDKERLAQTGRELWSELHTSVTFETLSTWETKIPNFACGCKKFYDGWKQANEPRQDDFFAWTVELHNAVNAKLGKPIMDLKDARQLWMV
jgi:hypothetical protein